MPNSDWFKRHKDNLAKWLLRVLITIVVLVVGGAAIVRGLAEQSEYEWAAYQRKAEYTTESYSPAYEACLSLSGPSQSDCITEANNEYRENDRKEQDLVAQQTTAVWTFLMGCAAIVGMMLSGLGVYLVWTTFAETRKANQIALNSATHEFGASLIIQKANIQIESDAIEMHLTIVNVGRGSANDIEISATYEAVDDWLYRDKQRTATGKTVRNISNILPSSFFKGEEAEEGGAAHLIWYNRDDDFKRTPIEAYDFIENGPYPSIQFKILVRWKTAFGASQPLWAYFSVTDFEKTESIFGPIAQANVTSISQRQVDGN